MNRIGKIIAESIVVLGASFAFAGFVATKKKKDSQYENNSDQKNPMEGKKVIFIEDENDKENADGLKGHLEAVGESEHKAGVYEKFIKRGIDVVFSFGGLVVLFPVFLGIAVAIEIDDPGPVFFTQKRVGANKKYFKLHKFRSMKMSTPHDKPTHMLENPEQYITKVGKFIRAHSLDELPQIWDIFIGNMSIIGPRPGLWNQDFLIAERDKYGANNIKPGLTGWAQVNGRDELEISVKAQLDGEYVQRLGIAMDAKVFLKSLGVFGGDDSVVEGGTGEMKKAAGRRYTEGMSNEGLIGHIGFGETVEVDVKTEKKVLITGASSYIGESFRSYAEENYPTLKVDTLDMLDPAWREKNFSEYDIVFHVAGIAHADVGNVDEATKAKYYEINTDLAIEVAEKAKAEGANEFVFMSSMIVYGDSAPYGQSKVVDGQTVPAATNFYGDSKLQADVAVRSLAEDCFKVIVLRPPMIYGKNSKGNYQTLAKLAKRIPIFPDVDNQRSVLYIDNLCEFLCQIMLVKEVNENAIVLIPQNAEWTKTTDMVRKIAAASGKKIMTMDIMKIAVAIGGKIPGKIGGLVNKAFGNSAYAHEMSVYPGINYQTTTMEESIIKTEEVDMKDTNSIEKVFPISDANVNVFIIGLRGYTQNYGGWEAFAHGLLDNWSDGNVHFYAYEKVDDYCKEEIVEVNRVTCIRVCEKETGSSAMMKYDKHCTDMTCEYVKKYNIKNPVMFHLGVRIGPYLWMKRNSIKKLGITMMENPAGAEWRRTKWGKVLQAYLYISAIMMAKSTDCMVCDNEGIQELYEGMLKGKRPILECVAYGVDPAPEVDGEMPQNVSTYFEKWGIEKDQYYLVLGRFIPENNYEMMFKGFLKSNTKRKLLVICNYQTEIQKFYEHIKESTGFESDSRVIMAGALYDKEILHYVRQYARGYIHGHSVGGTNPGLLEAMAETDVNILFDVSFNKYVGGDAAAYFRSTEQLAEIIDNIDQWSIDKKINMGIKAKERMISKYTWQHIVDEYSRIFHSVALEE